MLAKFWREPFDRLKVAGTPGRVSFNEARCKGCGYCVEFCPRDVLKMSKNLNAKGYLLPEVDNADACLGCGYCEIVCPEFAITVTTSTDQPQPEN